MSEDYFNNKLYPLQDAVLNELGKSPSRFYLTGGTYLSRFLLNHRYSEDLDFFLNMDDHYFNEVEILHNSIKGIGNITWGLRDDAFSRIFVERDGVQLKIEMVNDVKYRVDTPKKYNASFWIDNWTNVLVNKVTALSRLAAKDYVDIMFIANRFSFNWEEIINHAKQKDAWIAEHNAANFLLNFSFEKLDSVHFHPSIDKSIVSAEHFEILARDLFNGFDNSFHGKKL